MTDELTPQPWTYLGRRLVNLRGEVAFRWLDHTGNVRDYGGGKVHSIGAVYEVRCRPTDDDGMVAAVKGHVQFLHDGEHSDSDLAEWRALDQEAATAKAMASEEAKLKRDNGNLDDLTLAQVRHLLLNGRNRSALLATVLKYLGA